MTYVTGNQGQAAAELSAADEQVLRELTERARAGGPKLTGEGGLLGRLTKMVIEGALECELDDRLGYEKNDPGGRDGGNSRDGRRAKTQWPLLQVTCQGQREQVEVDPAGYADDAGLAGLAGGAARGAQADSAGLLPSSAPR